MAKKYETQGHSVSARDAYFRASNYYRSAEFFMHAKETRPKAYIAWSNSVESFLKGINYLDYAKVIEIPYKNGVKLPGYFFKTQHSPKEKPPLLIVHTGFDGTGEELFFGVGRFALERGYNCLVFEGPGQGAVIRKLNIPFRPDWEKVVTPVVDYALTREDVDPDNIALLGISMGGYLAPRAAAFEHRIKACVANGGVYDISEVPYKSIPEEMIELIVSNPNEFNAMMDEYLPADVYARWFYDNGIMVFGKDTPAELMTTIKDYALTPEIVKNIRCHMLVISSEADTMTVGADRLYNQLQSPKTFLTFTKEQTAQAHCQMGALFVSNEMIFNWLDDIFKPMEK